jgi:hypothetical protein
VEELTPRKPLHLVIGSFGYTIYGLVSAPWFSFGHIVFVEVARHEWIVRVQRETLCTLKLGSFFCASLVVRSMDTGIAEFRHRRSGEHSHCGGSCSGEGASEETSK